MRTSSENRPLFKQVYINRDPTDMGKGWGWLDIELEAAQVYGVPDTAPPSPRQASNGRNINLPSRGRAGAKKFTLRLGEEQVPIKAQKVLTVKAVCAWVKSWAPPDTQIISPGGYAYTVEGETSSSGKAHYVYFIFNADSDAIKIGRAKDVEKRLRSLQTASPIELKLLKIIPLQSEAQAKGLEGALHGKFWHLRMQGEWFKAEQSLMVYIKTGGHFE
ncbi:MAG: GIY-YIG nuclease family protein [Cyanobacteria bacterium]|nr:GIY-YIG nuclease family protein [Cyanobacteriota bacterium]MDA0867073.1 GIY-YIG nuclease family protein [Cyanobacteriota bacterium]